MSSISFGNLTTTNLQTNPELEQRLQSQENFTAIDKEKLKQDTVEIASKAGEQVKDNFIIKALKSIGVEDPKKTLKSVAYTILTMTGVAILGNRLSNKTADLGIYIDKVLKGDSFKWLQNIGNSFKKAKTGVGNLLKKSDTINDLTKTLKEKKLSAKNLWAKSYCSGQNYQFASAVIESMQGIFYGKTKNIAEKFAKNIQIDGANINAKNLDKEFLRKMILSSGDELESLKTRISGADKDKLVKEITQAQESSRKLLKHLIGEDNVEDAFKTIVDDNASDRVQFVKDFTEKIRLARNLEKGDHKGLLDAFKTIQKGEGDFEGCSDILMCHGMDNWTFTNWIDKIGHKIRGDKWKNVSRANLGSTLIKFNAVTGNLADSAPAKLIQASTTTLGESISNHVCDMAAINMLVLPNFIELYNNFQDAPKEQKVATLANDFATGVGSVTVVMPLAGAITYGIASLKKMDGKTLLSKPLKLIGKIFATGLEQKTPTNGLQWFGNKLKGFGGGAFRAVMIMMVFSGMISKPIEKIINKIFGKPYNKEEAQKAQQLEEQKKQVIPELGITQGELMEKMQNNPTALQKLQTDEKLAYTISQNPKALLDLLDNKEVQYIEPKPTPASQGTILSPANQGKIGNSTNAINKEKTIKKTNQVEAQEQNVDSATYIPSSAFTAPKSSLSQEQLSEYNSIMTRADKALAAAEKYI